MTARSAAPKGHVMDLSEKQMSDLTIRIAETAEAAVEAAAPAAAISGHADTLASLRSGPAASIIRDAIGAHIKDAVLVSVDSAVVTDSGAIVRAALAGAQALHGLKLGITGPQKLALVQSLVRDAIETLPVDEDVKAKLGGTLASAVPAAIDGLLFAVKAVKAVAVAPDSAAGAVAAVEAAAGCCVPTLRTLLSRGAAKADGAAKPT